MHLVQLVYFSRVPTKGTEVDIEGILRSARKHNAAQNISGMLCFRDEFFLQVIEGSRTAVNETFSRILRDSRHKNVVLLGYQPAVRRAFPKWSMHWVSIAGESRESLMRYSSSDRFEPDTMSAESAVEFMKEIAALGQRRLAESDAERVEA